MSHHVGVTSRGRPPSIGQVRGPALTLAEELNDLRQKNLLRKLRTLTDCQGTRARWQGKELTLFCGNDYLGLSRDPRIIEAARSAMNQYGLGSGAARLISGTTELHTRLEEEIARFKKKERALVFGAGYLANLGTLSALAGEKDLIVMDKLSHASLIDGARLSGATLRVFPHKDYERCEEILVVARLPRPFGGAREPRPYRRILLVSDTVFSMDGDLADLPELIRLKREYDCLLIVDDAHGLGVFGSNGRGVSDGLEEEIDCITGTFSKAFGVFGGFAAASDTLINHLINFSRPFIFATAPPPAFQAAALEALRVIQQEPSHRQKLFENVDRIQKFLKPRGSASGSPIFPIIIGEENEALRISDALLERGILIPAIRYPSVPKAKARLRLSVSAAHTEKDLEKLFAGLNGVLK